MLRERRRSSDGMRRFKKRYKRPKRPYDSARIEEEKKILEEYGLRRKREIWVAENILRNYRRRARELIAVKDKEKIDLLLAKLKKLGLLGKDSTLDDVLGLSVRDILNRRLQTIVWKKGIANTPKQARQYIVHGHIMINKRRISSPSYLVPVEEEEKIEARIKGG